MTRGTAAASNWTLIRRLTAIAWKYRARCIQVLCLQVLLLLLGVVALALTGAGIDFIRHCVQPGAPAPRWPLGVAPPADWHPMKVLTVVSALLLAVAALRTLLHFAYSIGVATLIERHLMVSLRSEVYNKLQRLSFRFFDENASGSIINRVTGDSRQIGNFVSNVILQGIVMVLSLAVYLTYMLSIHAKLTFVCLASTPLLWFVSTAFSRVVQPLYRRNRELMDELILRLTETVQGIQTIKGFAREREQLALFARCNQAVRDQQQEIFRRVSTFVPNIGFLTQINIFLLLAYGGALVMTDRLPLGAGLVVFAGLLQQFSAQISGFAGVANTIQQSLTGARRVFEVLDAPVEIVSPPNPKLVRNPRGVIRFESVSFAYRPGKPVLQNVSFETRPGECLAIFGATGSGKTTLLSLVPRFYDPTTGRVTLDGTDLRELDLDELRRNIGVVFQESFLFSNTIAANIAFGHPDATQQEIERAAKIAAAHEFIVSLPRGYDTLLREGGKDLSGGQRQRIALARAILLNPAILLLDDPTASVDPRTESEILQAIEQAMKGRTTLMVASRISVARRADRILVLEHGRVAQLGTHEQLASVDGPYRRALQLQFAESR
ncbi:MAG: ABC transporter ATP-binding protein/permease [Verrucomicrobiae bacterium]|nr:ABC transporter ATP-binding protein/permease [Verrucomicrobiae bacterium]